MKLRIMLTAVLLLSLLLPELSAEPNRSDAGDVHLKDAATVTVYYFHGSRRCRTCLSIERIARNIVSERYGDNKNIEFKSINIEKEKNKSLAKKYKVAGSGLLVCCGKEKVDLTAKAFQYARSTPEKLQDALIAAVEKFVK